MFSIDSKMTILSWSRALPQLCVVGALPLLLSSCAMTPGHRTQALLLRMRMTMTIANEFNEPGNWVIPNRVANLVATILALKGP